MEDIKGMPKLILTTAGATEISNPEQKTFEIYLRPPTIES